MESYSSHHVGLKPVFGILPAFCNHTLGGKINNVIGTEILDNFHDLVEIAIQIALEKANGCIFSFFVRKENGMWLSRPAYPDDLQALSRRSPTLHYRKASLSLTTTAGPRRMGKNTFLHPDFFRTFRFPLKKGSKFVMFIR
jgi:hypothetical protein